MTKHGTILLIEDDENDVMLMKKACVDLQLQNPLHVVHTCADAIKYLSGEGVYADRTAYPVPFLVLLDLKLPDQDGFAVLRWLYERPGLRKKFTVLTLSGGGPDQEVQLAYELGAQSFLRKQPSYTHLLDTLRRVKEYWVDLNLLPGDAT